MKFPAFWSSDLRFGNLEVDTVGSEEIENFDAQKWHREVDALLAEIQSKDCVCEVTERETKVASLFSPK